MKSLLNTPLGIEIEIVTAQAKSLEVLPITDKVLEYANKKPSTEHADGKITWSNELVNHVVEFKLTKPEVITQETAKKFHQSITKFSDILNKHFNGTLLPTGMHPFMDPSTQTQIWPGEYHEHYMAYHKLFNCYTHGFANLQSVHVNLPFHSESEFARLSAAIRVVLPLIPALAASSPLIEGKKSSFLDNRLEVYSNNQKKVDSITGKIIPEPIYTIKEYKQNILQKMYDDIAPFDTEKILQTEQLNSRGCIARFDRNTLEIRLIDSQENPTSDIAIVTAVVYLVEQQLQERWCNLDTQKTAKTDLLRSILLDTIKNGEKTMVTDNNFLQYYGESKPQTAQELLKKILQPCVTSLQNLNPELAQVLTLNLTKGPLARRILSRLPSNPNMHEIIATYSELTSCLTSNSSFK